MFENRDIKGFYVKDDYYNIEEKSIIIQNNKALVFYKESIASPINFLKSVYVNDTFELNLSGENLKSLIDGKAFKGIVNLGKDDSSWLKHIDWKMGVIALGIGVLAYLHLTGAIDLGTMLKLS